MLEPWAMLYLIIAICYVLYLIIQFYLKHENKKQKQQKLNKNPIQHRNTSIAKRLESINKSINILEEKILKSGRKPKKSNQKIGENLPMKPTGDGTGTVGSGGMAGELQGLRENAYITTEQILENSAHGTVYGSLSTQDQVIKQEPLGKPTRPYKRQTIPNLNSSRHVPYKNLKNNTSSSETSSTSRDSSPGNVQNFTETQTHQPNKEILTGLDYLRQGGLRNRKKVIPKHEKDIKFERMDKLRKAKRMREELEKIEAQERLIEEKLNLQNGGGWSKMDELKNKIYKGGVNSGNYGVGFG